MIERFIQSAEALQILEAGAAAAEAIIAAYLARTAKRLANTHDEAERLAIWLEETLRTDAELSELEAKGRAEIEAASSAVH